MPLFVIQVRCALCDTEHPTGMVLKLDEGPVEKQSVATFCGDQRVPPDLSVLKSKFVCPLTGQSFSPASNDDVYVVPQAYRF
jgi:hypothetical protein